MKFNINNLSRTQKAGLFLVILALVTCVVLIPSIRSIFGAGESGDAEPSSASSAIEIQDPDVQEMEDSKMEAYSSSRASSTVARYWDDLESEADAVLGDEEQNAEGGLSGGSPSGSAAEPASEDELFASLTSGVADSGPASAGQRSQTQPVRPSGGGRSPSVRGDAPKPGEPGYREYRMRQYYDGMDAAVLEGDRKKAASGGASSAGEESAEMTSEGEAPESRTSIGDDAPVRKSSAMSDLSSSGAGSGFSSLGDGSSETVSGSEDYPFECMFVRAEKLRNGSRVSIRLLEDMVVGGTLIPRNTHLMAMCAISDRLQLTVSNVEMNQRIYSLGYEAYDTDGSRGIYCPDLTQQDRRKIESQGLSSVGGILGRRVGSLASSAVQTGVSIAQSRSGEVTVSVPAGYKFYIVKKRN